ncbi:MAG: class I SAM-dependent methyltransferase [Sulfuricaulis sp.]|nr:class I SAM-dependent methyltransferase [Sulfuricaulis sp.]
MRRIREIAKRVPGIPYVYGRLRRLKEMFILKNADIEEVFANIFTENRWRGKDSFSGTGSDLHQTRVIIEELPLLFRDLRISTFLDIPCGDFHWMCRVDLKGVNYVGVDIVKELIQKNKEKYERENVQFQHLNLIEDKIRKVDLILCRDCLVHLSFDDAFLALRNICDSQSTHLLTTTFTTRMENHDIFTGQWRTLNLEIAPFNLPKPLRIINEDCTEGNSVYSDKSLGLWNIEDIKKCLTKHCV